MSIPGPIEPCGKMLQHISVISSTHLRSRFTLCISMEEGCSIRLMKVFFSSFPLPYSPEIKFLPNNSLFWIKCWFLTNFSINKLIIVVVNISQISFCWFSGIFLVVGTCYVFDNELIMNTYSNICPTLLICSDLIMVKYIVKLLIIVTCGSKIFVNFVNCDLSHEYKGRYWFTPTQML